MNPTVGYEATSWWQQPFGRGLAIKSFKRLSDGEVFVIGDKVNILGECIKGWDRVPVHTIRRIDVEDGGELSVVCSTYTPVCGDIQANTPIGAYMSGMFNIDQLNKGIPEVLFTTADGKPIREDDIYYCVRKGDWHVYETSTDIRWVKFEDANLCFSTESAAMAYSHNRKPYTA